MDRVVRQAALTLHNAMDAAGFDILLAYGYSDPENVTRAISKLRVAADEAEAILRAAKAEEAA
jgi:hypothetical protein